MSKHTSGPWYRVADQIFSNKDMTDLIAEVQGGSGTRYIDDDCNAECLANCKLIEAAPELLEALQAAIQELYDHAGEEPQSGRYAHLDRVVIKATGATKP